MAVTIFSTADINRQLRTGYFKYKNLLHRRIDTVVVAEARDYYLVRVLFICTVLIMMTLSVSMFFLFGIIELSVERLALFKVICTGSDTYSVAHLAILRQL